MLAKLAYVAWRRLPGTGKKKKEKKKWRRRFAEFVEEKGSFGAGGRTANAPTRRKLAAYF